MCLFIVIAINKFKVPRSGHQSPRLKYVLYQVKHEWQLGCRFWIQLRYPVVNKGVTHPPLFQRSNCFYLHFEYQIEKKRSKIQALPRIEKMVQRTTFVELHRKSKAGFIECGRNSHVPSQTLPVSGLYDLCHGVWNIFIL